MYITSGLYLNGQDEIIYLLQCNTNEHGEMIETQVPREILFHLMNIYDKSLNGQRVASMQHVFYDFDSAKIANEILNKNINSKHSIQAERMLLENKENMGFFYFRPSRFHYQTLLDHISIYLPDEPFLVGILLHRWEVPWAKLFPLRLYLRLGELFDCMFYIFFINYVRDSLYDKI